MTDPNPFTQQREDRAERETEVAYRIPGSPRGWVRRTFPSERQAVRFVDRLLDREGDDVEVRWAD